MIELLKKRLDDPRLDAIAKEAISFIKSAHQTGGHFPTGPEQSSKALAELQRFRTASGYYKKDHIFGLEESISCLSAHDVPVRLGVVEPDRGHVAVWVDQQQNPLGIMIFRTF